MQTTRNNRRGSGNYTPEQVESVLDKIGVEIAGETTNDFLCYCPFHGNRFSPSFSVSRESGTFLCFNAACAESGTFLELVQKIGKLGPFPAKRLIISAGSEKESNFKAKLEAKLNKKPLFVPWEAGNVQALKEQFWANPQAVEYMYGRGFNDEVLDYFDIGYSAKKDLLAVPMHEPAGKFVVGVVGRGIVDKKFKNSVGLPTSKALWNYHRARRVGDTVVLTEASFDAMRVHQAGFPNVVACLGGNFSSHHFEQLDRSFNTIIIMTDFDQKDKYIYDNCRKCAKRGIEFCTGHNPGRDLGALVAEGFNRKRVLWAAFGHREVYPHGAKDAGDLSDDEIRTCIKNAVTNLEYSRWGLY